MKIFELAMDAARRFGGRDGVFNGACFSAAMCAATRLVGPIDGIVVDVILRDRMIVRKIGKAHYQIRFPWRMALLLHRDLRSCDAGVGNER